MRKPLVLHVAEFRNPAGGGFVAGIARLARRHGEFRTALLCPEGTYSWVGTLRDAGAEVYTARTQLEVVAAIARLRPAIVHAHFVSWSLPAMLGAATARARLAWHLHSGVTPDRNGKSLLRRLKYAAAKRLVDRFYCVSPDLVSFLGDLSVPTSRIAELPNGVDLERFRAPTLAERVAARRRYALSHHEPAIVFFGRDAVVKGADRLAAVLDRMAQAPRVFAVASPPATLQLLRAHHPIDVGNVPDIRDVLWACDALALPSRVETVTFALLEARACELPAVASPLPGIQQVFGNDPGTSLVDPDDPAAYARAIERALHRGSISLPPAIRESVSLDVWADALATWYSDERAA